MTEDERQARLAQLRDEIRRQAAAKTAASEQPAADLSQDPGAGEVLTGVMQNAVPSGINVLKDTVTPFMHPIDTATSVAKLGAGAVEKLIPGEQGHEGVADAVGEHFANRYGDWPAIKRTFRDDPMGLASDASVLLSGGGTLAARAPGIVGKVGKVINAASKVEPVAMVTGTARGAVKYGPKILGAHSGVGHIPLEVAYQSGKAGGKQGETLRQAMRGDGSPQELLKNVEDAQTALGHAYKERGAQYTKDMSGIGKASATPPSANVFQSIGRAAGKQLNMHRFNGVDFSPATLPTRTKIYDTVVKWGNRDPKLFHTAEGLDKMKREIGDIRDGHEVGSPEFKAANDVYKAVDAEINKAFPDYEVATKNYAKTSERLDNMKRTLSLGKTEDAALRKLQSSMRDDVNTNFGARVGMIDELEKHSPGLKARLAGHSLSSTMPRGLSKHWTTGHLGMAGTAAVALHNPLIALPMAISAGLSSPRVLGEAAHFAGRIAGKTPKSVKKAGSIMFSRPMLQGSRGIGMLDRELEDEMLEE